MSRIILALPTKLEHVKIFEQTVPGGFSSVNKRLAFDTQILLPNLEYKDNLEKNPLNKGINVKLFIILNVMEKKHRRNELSQKF